MDLVWQRIICYLSATQHLSITAIILWKALIYQLLLSRNELYSLLLLAMYHFALLSLWFHCILVLNYHINYHKTYSIKSLICQFNIYACSIKKVYIWRPTRFPFTTILSYLNMLNMGQHTRGDLLLYRSQFGLVSKGLHLLKNRCCQSSGILVCNFAAVDDADAIYWNKRTTIDKTILQNSIMKDLCSSVINRGK